MPNEIPLQLVERSSHVLKGLCKLGYKVTNELNNSINAFVVNPLGYISTDLSLIRHCKEINSHTRFTSAMGVISYMQSKNNNVLVKGGYYNPTNALITSEEAVARCAYCFVDNKLTPDHRYRFRLYGCSFASHGEISISQAQKMEAASGRQIKNGLAKSFCPGIPIEEVMYMKRLDVLYTAEGPIYDLGKKVNN